MIMPNRVCGVDSSRRTLATSVALLSFITGPLVSPGFSQELLHAFVGDFSQWDQGFVRFTSVGDLNGDGVEDFLYGSSMPHMHRARSGADWSTLSRYRSTFRPGYPDAHGHDVAGVGSWDDDDVPDYAVGAPYAIGLQFWEGAVRVFSGATHTLVQEIYGGNAWDRMGYRVFGLGDLDGDGHPELATTGTSQFWVRIFSAPGGALLREHDGLFISTQRNPEVVTLGDWDGDGGQDYLIGEFFYSQVNLGGGRVALFSGKTGAELMSMVGTRVGEAVGVTVSMAGDWNGDGIDDVAAGAPGTTGATGGSHCGVYVFSGADGSILRFFDGADYTAPDAAFGAATVSGKDVNGDGFPDLLVGAPGEWVHPPHFRDGAMYVISGRTGAVLWKHVGRPENDYRFGQYLYLIDDHDDDGLAEWVVSDPRFTPQGEPDETGRIAIYRGAVGDATSGCTAAPNSVGPGAHLSLRGPISLRCNLTEFVLDLQAAPFAAGPGAIAAGDLVAFQLLYSDPAAGNRNASDSVVIRFLP